MNSLTEYIMEQAKNILAIDSPSGFTEKVTDYIMAEYTKLGYAPVKTVKGGVVVDLGGKDDKDALLMEAHVDTLGAMVAEIKADGRLRLFPIGLMEPYNGETENVHIYTRDGRVYEGCFQLINPSYHVNKDYKTTPRDFETCEVVIDENVNSKEEVKALGIMNGDIVAFEARTRVTASGYIKSRHLDDKFSTAILLGYAKYLKDNNKTPDRKIFQHITVYEEVGHGACGTVPAGTSEVLSVDMGCVGTGVECKETQVSICAADTLSPYDYRVTTNLINAAKAAGLDFAVDVYPYYISDADGALTAGNDVRHGLIGPGVYASHGYERSHRDGAKNTVALLIAYTGV